MTPEQLKALLESVQLEADNGIELAESRDTQTNSQAQQALERIAEMIEDARADTCTKPISEKMAKICTGEIDPGFILEGTSDGKAWGFRDLGLGLAYFLRAPTFTDYVGGEAARKEYAPTEKERATKMQYHARKFVMCFFALCLHRGVFGPAKDRPLMNPTKVIEYAVNYVLNHYTQEGLTNAKQ